MAINIFEGARRIGYLTAGLWAVGVVSVVFFVDEPRVEAHYVVFSPELPPGRADERVDCGADDRAESDVRTTTKGTKVYVRLCFKAQRFSNGRMLVPFRTDDKMMYGDNWLSEPVRNYAQQRMQQFSMSVSDQGWADSQYWPIRFRKAWTVVQWVAGGWLALWIFMGCVGWVVRGFAGIPSGHDQRPPSKAAHE